MNDISMNLSLKQQLRLNTQLLQTMDTIALSTEELREKIYKEAETNPTLIVREHTSSYNTLSEVYRENTDKRESYSDNSPYDSEDRPNWIEGTIGGKESLSEHLLKQLGCLSLDDNIRKTAETLITSLDRNGFTVIEPARLVSNSEKPYLEKALQVVQSLDPVGIGAIDWKDSLMLQLKATGAEKNELALFHKLIYKELENIKSGKIDIVARNLRTDREDVEAMMALLKTLTPFPGLAYSAGFESYIIPDITIKKVNGKLQMALNRDAIPVVEVDSVYKDMQIELKKTSQKEDKSAYKYLKEKLANTESLIRQLEARASTLERTGAVLMERQKEFFLYGPLYLKGLTMGEVADEVGVHEATISRVASSKYIDTDFGIFPIRYLFASKTRSESGEDVSKNAIKEMIRNLIEENKSTKALSDQKLSELLEEKGIKIARRTVAKYRKELNIDSSFERSN